MSTTPQIGRVDREPTLDVEFQPVQIEYVWNHQFKRRKPTKHMCAVCGKIRFHPNHGSPSFNSFGKNNSNYVFNEAKQIWQREVWGRLLTEAEMPICERVLVEGETTFHDAKTRDQGNYRYFMEKCVGDALQIGGWINNDNWDCFEFGNLRRTEPEPGIQRVRLTFFPS